MSRSAGEFEARLFGPGLPGAGASVRVRFDALGLHIRQDTPPARNVPLSALGAGLGGFGHDRVMLEFQDQGARWSLHLSGAGALAELRQHADARLRRELGHVGGSMRRQRAVWLGLGALALAAVLAGVTLVLAHDRVVAWVAWQIPPQTEARLGAQVLESLRQDPRLIDSGPALDAVRNLGKRLTRGSSYDYRWRVLRDDTANAFAAPGGVVVVHSGLIVGATTAEELAGVLAHEVQHVEQRHALQNMIHALGWATALAVVMGDVSAIVGVLVYQAGTSSFSRDLERQADAGAVMALHRAGIDPDGMLRFFGRLQAQESGGMSWLSSHPATAERIAHLQTLIDGLAPSSPSKLDLDWPAVRASLEPRDAVTRTGP